MIASLLIIILLYFLSNICLGAIIWFCVPGMNPPRNEYIVAMMLFGLPLTFFSVLIATVTRIMEMVTIGT